MEFYTSKVIAPGITRICDLFGVYAYLVEGNNRAVLIDTCYGIGDLRAFVDGLTALPVEVVCTHGHLDHVGGAGGFDTVHLHTEDWPLAGEGGRPETRYGHVAEKAKTLGIGAGACMPQRTAPYLPLAAGDVFDLGSERLELVPLPGHTPGSLAVLLHNARLLLLGDACNSATFLFLPHSSSVADYRAALLALVPYAGLYDSVLFSHPHNFGDKGIVADMIALCGEIIAGTDARERLEISGREAFAAKPVDKHLGRLDGGQANLLYKL